MSRLTAASVYLLCAAALCGVAGWPGSLELAVAALTLAGVRAAWMMLDGAFVEIEDVNEPGVKP